MENSTIGGDVFFILMGAILVFAMHAGFAFLEVGTVRKKNQVNAMVKILSDFGMSTLAYFFIGYSVAYGMDFLSSAATISGDGGDEAYGPQGLSLIKFFFLLTFCQNSNEKYLIPKFLKLLGHKNRFRIKII